MQVFNLLVMLLFFSLSSLAQVPQELSLPLNKTIHLFFPQDVVYNDVGSADVLIAVSENIVKLAAGLENFQETNLTVITADSVIYSFILTYKEDVSVLNHFIEFESGKKINQTRRDASKTEFNTSITLPLKTGRQNLMQDSLQLLCSLALERPVSFWDEGMYHKKVYLATNNIFVLGDKLFFVLSCGNDSYVDYDVDYFKILITDKKKAKRSSIQDIEKLPVYSYNKPEKVEGKTNTHSFVLVFDRFTIAESRKIKIEMGEKNGGRNISFSLKNDLILDAQKL